MDKLLLSPKEAAEMLSVSRSKLYELLAAGTLRSVRIDGCRRISVEVLRTYVEQLDPMCPRNRLSSRPEQAARQGSELPC